MRHAFLTALLCVGLLSCTSSDGGPTAADLPTARFDVTAEGTGAPNAASLFPLIVGTRMYDNGQWLAVTDARSNGLITVRKSHLPSEIYFRLSDDGVEYLGRADESAAYALLLLPKQVRYGMAWTSGGGDGVAFRVTGRSEERTTLGMSVIWTIAAGDAEYKFIEGVGPLVESFGGARQNDVGYDAFFLPTESPAVSADVAAVQPTFMSLSAEVAEYTDNFEPSDITALERADGTMTVTAVGTALYTGTLGTQVPAPDIACLHVDASGIAMDSFFSPPFDEPIFPYKTAPDHGCWKRDTSNGVVVGADGSAVHVNANGTALYLLRDGSGEVVDLPTLSGRFQGALFARASNGDPWALMTAEGFQWQRLEDGSGLAESNAFTFGPAIANDWGINQIYSFFDTNGRSPTAFAPTHGYWFAPTVPVVSSTTPAPIYHLSRAGLLTRTMVTETLVGEPDVLFNVSEQVSVKTTPSGHDVLLTRPDGVVRRLVLDNGSERIDTLGRVALEQGVVLVGAVALPSSPKDIMAVLAQRVGHVANSSIYMWQTRFARVSFGAITEHDPVAALGVSLASSGADAVVCWPQTSATLSVSGWSLGGKSALVKKVDERPCAIVVRDPTTTLQEMQRDDAFFVQGVVPGVGMMRMSIDRPRVDPTTFAETAMSRVGLPPHLATPYSMFDGRIVNRTYGYTTTGVLTRYELGNFGAGSVIADDMQGLWSTGDAARVSFTGEHTQSVSPAGAWAASTAFVPIGPVLGGGIAIRETQDGVGDGPIHLLQRDGTLTRVADGAMNGYTWLPNGNYCYTTGGVRCYVPGQTTPYAAVAPAGFPSGAVATLRSFEDGQILGLFRDKPYVVDLAAQTATLIEDVSVVGVMRRSDGSLWGAVSDTSGSTTSFRIARIRPDGVDVYELPWPAWIASVNAISLVGVYPGDDIFMVEFAEFGQPNMPSFARFVAPVELEQ